ncbi:hypothetical protein CAPTEDRAFT_188127 [Capitella teleta]|uniref:Nucleolar 27S pre-rRNA processing Urb2/Npa2 C-terminal domain-containing protein n=1 Tax=Capitella teleta TaxID=283909 RepID=R7V0H5_CAPTE|nr:hypothetical protein CAPTEDRAFT_188127 [Capitella teleta]|eukprot:ELU12044.1 hypothetical protein CAPTEDRAFT_188127 [Capitella teleta]
MAEPHGTLTITLSDVDFYQSLKSAAVPWADKVKLVRYGWKHDTVVLVDKHQFLLDWIANKVLNSRKKFKLSDADASVVWCCFSDILSSADCQIPRATRSLQIHPQILQAIVTELNRVLSNESHVDLSVVALCSHKLLSTPFSKSILISDSRNLANLLAVLLQLLTRDVNESDNSSELFPFLSLVVDCCQQSLKWQPDQNVYFVEVTLLPAVKFLYAMRNSSNEEQREKVQSLLWNSLFDRFSLPKWTTALIKIVNWAQESKNTPGKAIKLIEVTFQRIKEEFKVDNGSAMVYFLPLFFKSYIQLSKTDESNVWDRLFVHLGSLAGFACDEADYEMSLSILAGLLEVAVDTGIYETCNLNVDQMKTWLHMVIEWVLKLETRSKNWFAALKLLVKFDHTLFERRSSTLLRTAWLLCAEPESSEAQGELLAEIFSLYNQLRLVPGLLHKLILALTQSAGEISDIAWPQQLLVELASIVGHLPQSSIIEIWEDLLKGLTATVQDDTKDAVTAALCKVLSVVVVNCQLIGPNITNLTMQSAEKLMEQTWSEVLLKLLPRINIKKKISANVLSLRCLELLHAYGELHSLLSIQSLKYTPAQSFPPEVTSALAFNDLSLLFKSIDGSSWNDILKKCLGAHDKRVVYLHRQLLIQKLRLLLVMPSSDAVGLSVTNVVDQLMTAPDAESEGGWSGQVDSITDANHCVASWHQLLPCLPMILSSLSSEQLNTVAEFLLSAYLSTPTEGDTLNLKSLSEEFLRGSVSQEMLTLHSALNKVIWKKIARVLDGGRSTPAKSDEEWALALNDVNEQLLQISDLKQSVISDEGAQIISSILSVFRLLPLRFWSKPLVLDCVLGLLALAPIATASNDRHLRSAVLSLLTENTASNPAARLIAQHVDCAAYLQQTFPDFDSDVKSVAENVLRLSLRHKVGFERLEKLLLKLKEGDSDTNSRQWLLLVTQILAESLAVNSEDACKELYQSVLDHKLFVKPKSTEKAATLAAFSSVLCLGETEHLDAMCQMCLSLLEEKSQKVTIGFVCFAEIILVQQREAMDSCAAFLKTLSSSEDAVKKGLPEAFLPSAWNLLQLHMTLALSQDEDFTFSRSRGESFVRKDGTASDVTTIELGRQSILLMADEQLRAEIWLHADAVFVSFMKGDRRYLKCSLWPQTSEAAVHHPHKVILALRTCALLLQVDASKSLLQDVLLKCQHVALRTRSIALIKQLLQFQSQVLSFGIRYFKGNAAVMVLKTLFGLIANCKARMSDVALFLIARYVDEVQTSSLIPEMKRCLVVCMHTLLTLCDDFTVAHLNATFPPSVAHIFQKLYSEYVEHYKFSGKI